MASRPSPERKPPAEEPADAAQAGSTPRYAAVTWRAVLLGLFGAVCVTALQVASKVVPRTVVLPFQSALTLLSGAVFWLFLLAILNAALRRWRPRAALRPAEFAVIYGITTVAAGIAAQDEVMQVFPMFVYPFRATQADAMGPFRQYIPAWLVPQDPNVVEPYYLGGGTFWTAKLLLAWAVPLLSWMLWLGVLGATMWAWNVILRRRWMDHDRLAFPCLQLPLEICREGGFGGVVSGRLFWGGLLCSTLLECLDRAHARFPGVPSVPLGFAATPLLDAASPPWNALSPMYLAWSTLHLGVCYFIPLDILFSGWFFYLFRKAMEVFGFSMGWRELGWDAAGFPFTRVQAAGAWIALFFLLVWAERHHLRRVMRAAFRLHPNKEVSPLTDADEPGSYRWAGRILLFGTVFLIAWSVMSGMSLSLALIFYGFFWMLNVTMTRIYAQVGPPILELYFLDPQKTITTVLGTAWQSPRSLTMFSLMYWINRTDRGHPMAHQLSAFRIGKATNTEPRALGKWVWIAFVVGCLTCLLAHLHWAYRVGEDQYVEGGWREAFAPLAVSRINDWVKTPKGPQWTEVGFMTLGAATTLALAKANYTYIGFPFHPIGFALAMCFTLEYNWPAFLGMWIFKTLLLRYGGRSLYQRFVPFFLGLTLGGLVAPVCWGFLSYLFNWYT
jgi:hypothetical protein